jgi:hypothetical protein
MKQIPFALVGGLDCAQKKALPEPSGAGEEIVLSLGCQLMDKMGLVHIIVTFFNQVFKSLNPNGQFFRHTGFSRLRADKSTCTYTNVHPI